MKLNVKLFRDAQAGENAGGETDPLDLAPAYDTGGDEDENNDQGEGESAPPEDKNDKNQAPPNDEQQEKQTENTAPVVDWRESIKAADKYEALKELGYDEFTIGMLKYKDETGEFTPYVEAKTVDYTKMEADHLFKLELKKAHPTYSEKAIDLLFNRQQNEKYYLDREDYPEDSDEAIVGQELRQADAENLRKKFIDEQGKFKAPERQADAEAQQREQAEQVRQQKIQKEFLEHPAVKGLQEKKSISFGDGEGSFSYPVKELEPIIQSSLNTFLQSEHQSLEKVNVQDFLESMVIASNLADWKKKFAEHNQAIMHRKVQDELQNRQSPNNTPENNEGELTPAQELARYGRYSTR